MTIRVVRVREVLEIEQELIPFETRWIADPDMLIDASAIRNSVLPLLTPASTTIIPI